MDGGDVIEGRFRIDRPRGEGGMGAVFRAVDLTDGTVAALKFLVPAAARSALDGWLVPPTHSELQRFDRERRLYALLGGPGVPRLLHHGRYRRRPYMALQYIDGLNLREFLGKNRPGITTSVCVMVQLLRILDRVHQHPDGAVHRDVKPHNILLEREGGLLYLADFGIALPTDPHATRYTEGATPGTMGYMAPEIINGEKNPTGAADVYASGCLFFELLTGRPVFECSDNAFKWSRAHLHERPPRLDHVLPSAPGLLVELLDALLAKDPERRLPPATAADLLHPLLPQPGDPAPAPTVDPDPSLPFRCPARVTAPEPPPPVPRSSPARNRRSSGTVDRAGLQSSLRAAHTELHGFGAAGGPAIRRLTTLLLPAQSRWGRFDHDVITARILVADRQRLEENCPAAGKDYRDVVRDLVGVTEPGTPAYGQLLAARLGAAECLLAQTDVERVDDVLSTWTECADGVREVLVGPLLGRDHVLARIRELGQEIAECGHRSCAHPAAVAAVLQGLRDLPAG
ncbi:serine/threonine protein kinase [Streptomyces sp. URMC 126]|uniref:serine/threonine protein kinase n=1 Tax=Streptomyces sp. URMC 126 TaxID=3423401 RepID=UPI003F1DE754